MNKQHKNNQILWLLYAYVDEKNAKWSKDSKLS